MASRGVLSSSSQRKALGSLEPEEEDIGNSRSMGSLDFEEEDIENG